MVSKCKLEDNCLFFLDLMGQSEKLGDPSKVEAEIGRMSNTICYLKETTKIKYVANRQQFSDTVLIYFKTTGLSKDEIIRRVDILIGRIGCIFIQCLAGGMPFRGVGLIGKGFELEENNFYGPVLLEASKLEKAVPQYPRVVLTNSIMEYFEKNSNQTIFEDDDGCSCINPLADRIREAMFTPYEYYKKCLDFIEKEKKEHSNDLYIRSKYTRLENMFKKWGKNWEKQKDE